MIKNPHLIFILSFLLLSACAGKPEPEINTMRFDIRSEYVASWEDTWDGVTVHLNQEGSRKLRSVTRDRQGKNLEIYANRCLVQTSTIDQVFGGGPLDLDISGGTESRIKAILPAEKKS